MPILFSVNCEKPISFSDLLDLDPLPTTLNRAFSFPGSQCGEGGKKKNNSAGHVIPINISWEVIYSNAFKSPIGILRKNAKIQ